MGQGSDSSSRLRAVVAAMTTALVMGWSTLAVAQTPAEETAVPGGTLMVIGYLVLWVMLGAYLFSVMWRQRRLQDEIDELEQRIDETFAADGELSSSGPRP